MSVGVVIVSHGSIGKAIIEAAEFILDDSLDSICVVSLEQSGAKLPAPEDWAEIVSSADNGDGVLILTDLPGATPCNLVSRAAAQHNGQYASTPGGERGDISASAVVSGLNLAMLLRVWNYRTEPLQSLKNKAISGGRKGIGETL